MLEYMGKKIVIDESLIIQQEDWSKVRSKPRAKRRRKQGHQQNIEIVLVPDTHIINNEVDNTLIMHPATYEKLKATVEKIQVVKKSRKKKVSEEKSPT